jgi:hypothetical protein
MWSVEYGVKGWWVFCSGGGRRRDEVVLGQLGRRGKEERKRERQEKKYSKLD